MGLLNIRRGNDIRVVFRIMDGDAPYDITGATGFTVSVESVHHTGFSIPVSDLSTAVNPLMFTIKGMDTLKVPTDQYRVVVSFVKDGRIVTLDAVGFGIVNYTGQAGEAGCCSCPNVQAETVSLDGQAQFAATGSASVVAFTYDPATRAMTITQTDGSALSITLPQSNGVTDGLMTTADVATMADLVSKVQSLTEGGVWRATSPTYADMETAYPGLDVSGTNWFVNDFVFVLADETHGGAETSYIVEDNAEVKTLAFRKTESTPIAQASNASLGVVKGDPSNGKVYVEPDGTMSLWGYDALATDREVVHLAGAETVTGVKTFAASPSVPTPAAASDAVNKGYVDSLNARKFIPLSNLSNDTPILRIYDKLAFYLFNTDFLIAVSEGSYVGELLISHFSRIPPNAYVDNFYTTVDRDNHFQISLYPAVNHYIRVVDKVRGECFTFEIITDYSIRQLAYCITDVIRS